MVVSFWGVGKTEGLRADLRVIVLPTGMGKKRRLVRGSDDRLEGGAWSP